MKLPLSSLAALRRPTRQLLCAGAWLLGGLPGLAQTAPPAPPKPYAVVFPKGKLTTRDAEKVNGAQFLSLDALRFWQQDLDARGLRATGGAAQEGYVDALRERLRQAGVQDVHFEDCSLQRWAATSWKLESVQGATAEQIPDVGYIPYSGVTPAAGITAPTVYLAAGARPTASVAGKIVVFEAPVLAIPAPMLTALALRPYDPAGAITDQVDYTRPHMGMGSFDAMPQALTKLGAVGMVAVRDVEAASARNFYRPYTGVISGVPGVFVDRRTGARLRALAQQGAPLHLTLPAQVTQATTRNLVGLIPGASDEVMVLHSHTDGTNGLEDNGPNAIVDMAQYLTRLPRAARPRTILVLLSTGHFAGGTGTNAFVSRHQTDGLLPRIGAAITIEHLGAMEWQPSPSGELKATGAFEPGAIFTPRIPALIAASEQWFKNANAAPGFVLPPLAPENKGNAKGKEGDAVWPGDGQYFWKVAGIPDINYITGPYYLLSYNVSTADKVDYPRLHQETVAFTQLLLDLSRLPLAELHREVAGAK